MHLSSYVHTEVDFYQAPIAYLPGVRALLLRDPGIGLKCRSWREAARCTVTPCLFPYDSRVGVQYHHPHHHQHQNINLNKIGTMTLSNEPCRLLTLLLTLLLILLLLLPPNRLFMQCAPCVYDDDEQMKWAHDMVLTSMREIFACFEGGSSEVKRERRALVAQTDNSIEVRSFVAFESSNRCAQ